MPRLSKEDQARTAELKKSMGELGKVVRMLDQVGVTQRAVARAAGINVGYLSQLLDASKGKVPTSVTVEKLLRGLADLADEREPSLRKQELETEVEQTLTGVESRLGVVRAQRATPGGIIAHDSPAYVRRSCDNVAERLVADAGDYLIGGPPQSGRSSLAKKIEALADGRGQQVVFVDLSLGGAGEEAVTELPVAGAIVRAIVGRDVATSDWSDLSEPLEEWLDASRRPSVVILDNANAGPPEAVKALLQVVRYWHNRRSSALPANEPYRKLATWLVMTADDVRDARFASSPGLRQGTVVETPWFIRDEVRALASAYPAPAGTNRRRWTEEVVEEVRSLFAGQPLLTHHYVHERSVGAVDADAVMADPRGAFQHHLLEIATLVALSRESALAVASAGTGGPSWSSLIGQWNVVNGTSPGWSCSFYSRHLPAYVEEASGRPGHA